MGKKPTYEELEQRVKELEKEVLEHKRIEDALKESEEQFRQLAENIREVFYINDPMKTHMIYVSPAYEEIWGRTCESLYEQPTSFVDAIFPEDRKRVIATFEKQRRGEPIEVGYRIVRSDGSLRWVRSRAYPVFDEDGNLYRIVGIAEDITKLKQAEEMLRKSEKTLRFLSSQLLTAQEKERRRLSKELHDELGQGLALLKHRLRAIQRRLQEGQSSLREECEDTSRYIDQIIENVRRLSKDLSPSILQDLGLSAALRWLVENFTKQHSIQTSVEIENIDHLFSLEAQTNLYRIAQEALTNISKHAKANHVSFAVKQKGDCVSFILEDNGKGFEVNQVSVRQSAEKGVGLAAVDERAHMAGALLDIRSQPGEGTRITLTIPIEKGGIS